MVVLGGGRFLVSEVPLHMVGMVAAIREEVYFLFASRLGSFFWRCVKWRRTLKSGAASLLKSDGFATKPPSE